MEPYLANAAIAGFHRVPLFDEAAINSVVHRVKELENRWVRRAPNSGFFTLGRNCYMDLASQKVVSQDSLVSIAASNDLLLATFPDVLDTCVGALRKLLGAPCLLEKRLAVPGFHIWLPSAIPRGPRDTSLHYDLQFNEVVRLGLHAPPFEVLSFTVPFALPMAGGYLDVQSDSDYRSMVERRATWRRDAEPVAGRCIEYRVGELVVHGGLLPHRIGSVSEVGPRDFRITLQGHAIVKRENAFVYW